MNCLNKECGANQDGECLADDYTFERCEYRAAPSGNRHQIKCNPESFWAIVEGAKPFTTRLNDRDYQVGDILDIEEFVAGNYTGHGTTQRVTCVCAFGCQPDYVVLGLKDAMELSGAVEPPIERPASPARGLRLA